MINQKEIQDVIVHLRALNERTNASFTRQMRKNQRVLLIIAQHNILAALFAYEEILNTLPKDENVQP